MSSSALPSSADDSHLPSKKRKKPPPPPPPPNSHASNGSGICAIQSASGGDSAFSSSKNEDAVTTYDANNTTMEHSDPTAAAASSSFSSTTPDVAAASLPRAAREEKTPSRAHAAAVSSSSTTNARTTILRTTITTSRSNICPSRLPSKKRKGSQDSSFSQQTSTTNSSCVQFEDDVKGQRRRNDSCESTTTATATSRTSAVTEKAVTARLKAAPAPLESATSESVVNHVQKTIATTTSGSSHGEVGGVKRNSATNAMPSTLSNKTSNDNNNNDDDDDDDEPPRRSKRKLSCEKEDSAALSHRKDSTGSAATAAATAATGAAAAPSRARLGSFYAPNDLLYGTFLHGEESIAVSRVRLDSISAPTPRDHDDDGALLLPNILHRDDESTTRTRLDSFYLPNDSLSGSLHSHELMNGGEGATKRKDSADSAASRARLGSFSDLLLSTGSVNSDEAKASAKRKDSADSALSIRARLHSFSVANDMLSDVLLPSGDDDTRARINSLGSITARSRKSSSSMNDLLVDVLQQEEGNTNARKRKDSRADLPATAAAISRKNTTNCGPTLLQRSAGRPRTRTNSVSSLENEDESLKQQRKLSHDSSISASSPHLGITHDSGNAAAAVASQKPEQRLLDQRKGSRSENESFTKRAIDGLLPSGSFDDVECLPLASHLAGPTFEDSASQRLSTPPLPPPSHKPLTQLEHSGTTDDATLTPTMSNDSSNRTFPANTNKKGNASGAALAAAAALDKLDELGGKLSAIEKDAAAAAAALSTAVAPPPPPRSPSLASADGEGPIAGVVAMPSATTTSKVLQKEEDDQSSAGTQVSSGNQRLLYEAIMMTAGTGLMATAGCGTATAQGGDANHGEGGVITGRERFESIGSFLDVAASFRNRDRLESWGGMSDLSLQLGGGGSDPNRPPWNHGAGGSSSANPVAAPAATETTATAAGMPPALDEADLLDMFPAPARGVPSRISMERDRLNSIASLSEASFTGFPVMVDGVDMTLDVQAFVAAAMASVGDQLAELAGAVESAASLSGSTAPIDITAALAPLVESAAAAQQRDGDESETSSAAEPMIGAALEGGMGAGRGRRRPRSWSTSSGRISVDYEAVAQAVDAAHAATGALDLASIANSSSEGTGTAGTQTGDCIKKEKHRRTRRQLPLKRARAAPDSDGKGKAPPTSKVTMSDEDIDHIRERARAAAGYVPPQRPAASKTQAKKKASVPLKKRVKRPSPNPDRTKAHPTDATPKISNKTARSTPEDAPSAPFTLSADVPTSSTSCNQTKAQTNQKWDSMFDCLVEFIDERRAEETIGQSEEYKNAWIWDGNVPTTHKAKDGKALGRWVNNQRSSKSKGSLKDERQQRLESLGLKWSVLVSNSWNDALGELQKYVDEQKKAGKEWDGNVPTNYQIKSSPNGGGPQGEDRNLGRWVNRQRSLYQSGKLRKDRQLALEKMGLKWSMLASTSWESMYETFCEYVQQKKASGVGGSSEWDGNVPATYRTNDNPPRGLGRWVNRQRSAYMKKNLKKEYVDKLNAVGLKWSVHERGSSNDKPGEAGTVGSCDGERKPAFITSVSCDNKQDECKADNAGSSDFERNPSSVAAEARR